MTYQTLDAKLLKDAKRPDFQKLEFVHRVPNNSIAAHYVNGTYMATRKSGEWMFGVPWRSRFVDLPQQELTYSASVTVKDSSNDQVSLEMSLTFKVENAQKFMDNSPVDYGTRMYRALAAIVGKTIANHSATQITSKVGDISQSVLDELKTHGGIKEYGLEFGSIDFTPNYDSAAIRAAQQVVEERGKSNVADERLNVAKKDGAVDVAYAQAEAEAHRVRADAQAHATKGQTTAVREGINGDELTAYVIAQTSSGSSDSSNQLGDAIVGGMVAEREGKAYQRKAKSAGKEGTDWARIEAMGNVPKVLRGKPGELFTDED